MQHGDSGDRSLQERAVDAGAAEPLDGVDRGADGTRLVEVDRAAEQSEPLEMTAEEAADARIRAASEGEPSIEQSRVEEAAAELRKVEWLTQDEWVSRDPVEREVALRTFARKLQDVYHSPAPPMITADLPEDVDHITLGNYSESDYLVKINNQLLAPDCSHPRRAVEAVAHEFRHAYQHEMALRLRTGLFASDVADRDAAAEWERNLRPGHYVAPEDDPERYRAQPVEVDARAFAKAVCDRAYGLRVAT